MDASRILLVVLAAAILGVAGWIAVRTIEEATTLRSDWEILLGDPILVGDLADPFAYAGGDAVRSIDGEGRIRVSEGTGRGLVRASVQLDGTTAVLGAGEPPTGKLLLRGQATDVAREIVVHGDSDLGDPRLPETPALLAGAGPIGLRLDGIALQSDTTVVWSVADALRRDDGAIRNRGLVFSPLLRDDTVFADPDRLEATLLVSLPSEGDDPRVVAHIVFRRVEIVGAPRGVSWPE